MFFTAFHRRHWPNVYNDSGLGDTRFAPLHDDSGSPVPTFYGARTRTVALLETAFHEVAPGGARVISEAIDLAPRGLARLVAPRRLVFIDLRDDALSVLGLTRAGLVATLPEHYACTRDWARTLWRREHVGGASPVGLVWHSRKAELAQEDSELFADLLDGGASEVFIVFGDRAPVAAAEFAPSEVYEDLAAPAARNMIEEVARQLRATIVTA